ncbi:non-specific serine/threonine protein kinase [Ranunculus cassubicifolius]
MAKKAYGLLFVFLIFLFHGASSIEDDVKTSLINFLSELTQTNGIIDPYFGWNMSSDPCSGQWKGITCNNQSTAVKKIILDNLNLAGSLNAESLCSAQSITVLSLNNNSISGRIPQEIVNCKQLTHLYASGNKFSGSLPDSFSGLSNLKRLVISNNKLSGVLPDLPRISGLITFLAEVNQFTGGIPKFDFSNVQDFNVSFNNFSGPIPPLGLFSTSSILGNPGLCGEPLSNACPPPTKKMSKHVSTEKALMYSGYALIVLLFVMFVAYRVITTNTRVKVVTQRVSVDGSSSKPSKGVSSDTSRSEYSITSAEAGMNSSSLVVLTSPFSRDLRFEDLLRAPAELLGRGKHGSLYKVTMENHAILAVKRIKEWDISSDDFKKRLEKIDRVKHPSVLPAVAFYCSKEEKLLVYEYHENGSLFKVLYESQNGKTFDWNSRLNVSSSIADALAYMHENLSKDGVPHGNIKSSNILFDKNMEPCVSEYGLFLVDNQDSFSLASKTGYNSTEESKNSQSSSFKVDIYGFGVVLLELLTGKLVQSNGSELARWVHSVVQEEWTVEVFDKALVVEGASEERMVNLLQVALKCINPSPEARPTMSEVALIINTIKEEDERSTGSDP